MTQVEWDKIEERIYETGVDHAVLYPLSGPGVAWNGLISVNETPEGGEPEPLYADGLKYLNLVSNEEFKATIEAFTYPEEFEECDGFVTITQGLVITNQSRKPFGLSYRTLIGDNISGTDYGYKIHLVYNATASPTDRANESINDDPNAMVFQWEIDTVPEPSSTFKPTAHLVIDSRKIPAGLLLDLEDILYGDTINDPRLPSVEELVDITTLWTGITITDNGDGTWTAGGPADDVFMTDSTTFQIDDADATYIDADTYEITSN